jgi:hypothetical protein
MCNGLKLIVVFLVQTKIVLLGNIYIPPESTKYSCLDAFNEIESEMFQLSEHSDLIGLLGDINAKTGKLLDYVETDKSLLNIFAK